MKAAGVKFTTEVEEKPWGKDALFEDPYGNTWLLHSDDKYEINCFKLFSHADSD